MRYQDPRLLAGAGMLLLELRLWLARSRTRPAPVGRTDALSDHQLKDIGLDGRAADEPPVAYWRLRL